jgi:two-component system, cell cycle sensor histidine kinase and response regulator CckA
VSKQLKLSTASLRQDAGVPERVHHAASDSPADPPVVLVVDDDPVTQQLLRDVLESQGFGVRVAESGDAVARDLGAVDLVLLDAVLPGQDGWSICTELKSLDPHLPIIMVTGRTTPEDVVRTFAAGADDYVAKPFQVPELLARIGSRLRVRRADAELRRAVERHRLVGLATNEAIWEYDIARGEILWNDGLTRVFGWAPEAVSTTVTWWRERVHPDERDAVVRSLEHAIRTGEDAWSAEYRFLRGDGSYAATLDRGYVVREAGRATRLVGSMRDVSARRRAEDMLQFLTDATASLSATLDYQETLDRIAALGVGPIADCCVVCVVEDDGTIVPGAAAHRDPARRPAIAEVLATYRPDPADPDVIVAAVIESGQPRHAVFAPDAAGTRCVLQALGGREGFVVPLRARDRAIGALALGLAGSDGTFDDAARRLALALAERAAVAVDNARLYRAAQNAENRYRLLFDHNPLPLLLVDAASDAVLAANEAAVALYGHPASELTAIGAADGPPPPGPLTAGVWEHRTRDRGEIQVEVTTHTLRHERRDVRIVLVHDITEQVRSQTALRESEEQLRQAQKMEAVGRLAGGVAHDFNNLLTAIQGHAELLLADLPTGHVMAGDVDEIRRAAERATSLTRQLLAFSRRQVLQPRLLNVNEVVSDMERMLRRLIGSDIRLETGLADGLQPVLVDPGQLEQVILNLALNARDAMPAGGVLGLATDNVRRLDDDGVERAFVHLSVRDTGEGIAPELVEKIFEPFFTTKALGRGTGLGLSTVYGIVRQTGGNIVVHSDLAAGTVFDIFLPAADRTRPAVERTPDPRPSPTAGSETILLVEDEAAVRRLAVRILQRHGYRVIEAANGGEAIRLARTADAPIDLLLTDMVMPGIGGRELAGLLAAERPGLRVLFMSGYTEEAIMKHGVVVRGAGFIEKPFSPALLARRVRQILAAPAEPLAPGRDGEQGIPGPVDG